MKRFDSFFQPNWGATAQTAPARAPNAAPAFIAGQRPPAVPRPAVALAALVGALALWLVAPAPGALAQPAPTVAGFDMPVRRSQGDDYLAQVDEWHAAIAQQWQRQRGDL